ncbi:MAG: hypothetical protein R3F62_12780 [Planctomycetota bacterium]
MKRVLRSGLLALAIAGLALGQDGGEADYAPEAMGARFGERLQPALEEALSYRFEAPVRFERVTREGMSEVLAKENMMLLAEIEGGWRGEELERECEKLGQQLGAMVMAKLDFRSGSLHVVPENFTLIAGLEDAWQGVGSQRFLDLILVHEAVHAFQQRTVDFEAYFSGCTSVGQLKGRMSVVEGHAQFITRKVAKALGLEDMFALFLSVSTDVPESIKDPMQRAQLEAVMQNIAFPYTEGEAFFTALVEALGYEAALERAFGEPPTTLRQVSHPDEFLEPVAEAIDVEALAQRVAKELLSDAFGTQVMPLPETALATSFGLAGEKGQASVERVRSAQVIVATSRTVAGAQVLIALLELDAPEAGADVLEVERVVSEKKDEQLQQNPGIELKAVSYAEAPLEGRAGFYVRKDLAARGTEVTAELAVVQVGSVVLEVTRVGLPGGQAATVELAQRVCELIEGKPQDE